MPQIAIIHDPTSNHASTWVEWLQSAGLQVDTICDEDSFSNFGSNKYDLVIPLITISDYVNKDNARMRAMTHFSAMGLHLLTPAAAIAISSDKLLTAKTLHEHSLPHPWTVLTKDYSWNSDESHGVIIKPRFGHSGREVYLAKNESDISDQQDEDFLAQHYIKDATCIRVTASPTEILEAYKKIPPTGEVVANINKGSRAEPITLSSDMEQLAKQTVRALGGGLMGVDLLDSPEGLFVLEANVPFGFDQNDGQLRQKLISYIKEEAR